MSEAKKSRQAQPGRRATSHVNESNRRQHKKVAARQQQVRPGFRSAYLLVITCCIGTAPKSKNCWDITPRLAKCQPPVFVGCIPVWRQGFPHPWPLSDAERGTTCDDSTNGTIRFRRPPRSGCGQQLSAAQCASGHAHKMQNAWCIRRVRRSSSGVRCCNAAFRPMAPVP